MQHAAWLRLKAVQQIARVLAEYRQVLRASGPPHSNCLRFLCFFQSETWTLSDCWRIDACRSEDGTNNTGCAGTRFFCVCCQKACQNMQEGWKNVFPGAAIV